MAFCPPPPDPKWTLSPWLGWVGEGLRSKHVKMKQKREPRLMRCCKFSSELLYTFRQTYWGEREGGGWGWKGAVMGPEMGSLAPHLWLVKNSGGL